MRVRIEIGNKVGGGIRTRHIYGAIAEYKWVDCDIGTEVNITAYARQIGRGIPVK